MSFVANSLWRHPFFPSFGFPESRPPERRFKSACVALSMPFGTRACQVLSTRLFSKATNSGVSAGSERRDLCDTWDVRVVCGVTPGSAPSASPANTHSTPTTKTANTTELSTANRFFPLKPCFVDVRVMFVSPGPTRAPSKGAASREASGRVVGISSTF